MKKKVKNTKNKKMLKEWNDTHIPKGRVKRHTTSIPKSYWIAIGDTELFNNYSQYVSQNLQLSPVHHNVNPSYRTIDLQKAKTLALRAVAKFKNMFIFIGVDDTSRGVMTGKNHLRSTIRYYYDPRLKIWNDSKF